MHAPVILIKGKRGEIGVLVGSIPRNAQSKQILHCKKVCKYAELDRASGYHDDEPKIELRFGPIVFSPHLADEDGFSYFGHFAGM